ncbi:MAG: ATP-binding protein [Planctomycetota bacterium]
MPAPPPALSRLLTRRPPGRGFLAGLRVRKKLVVLHTTFSVGLLAFLVIALRPAVQEVVDRAETAAALSLLAAARQHAGSPASFVPPPDSQFAAGTVEELHLDADTAEEARLQPGTPIAVPLSVRQSSSPGTAAMFFQDALGNAHFYTLSTRIPEARAAVIRLYIFTVLALVGVYAFIAVALELFVLPRHVYAPIQRLLDADAALREGRVEHELIGEGDIPSDELGEIMRSRNESVIALRTQKTELAVALSRLEEVATDLKRKNHLLENAQRNLADADRLASLGMMSAGIAHELNTPLAVLKGLVEKIDASPSSPVDPPTSALMLRVVNRLERLGDSLLDFARVRPPATTVVSLRHAADEARILILLEPGPSVQIDNRIPPNLSAICDPARLVQVLVNVLRNAKNSIVEQPPTLFAPPGLVEIDGLVSTREGCPWASITVTDNGPGIDPSFLPRLFEPFATTRLDSRGTGLGLAVAEGIIKEHGGLLLARNRPGRTGAVFEIILPVGERKAELGGEQD